MAKESQTKTPSKKNQKATSQCLFSRLPISFEHFSCQNVSNHLFNINYSIRIMPVLFIFEIIANIFIVKKIKYTEIDWSTYVQQVELFLDGVRDYGQIKGDTGPVVYPAGHLYINTLFYYLSNSGKDIFTVQCLFIGVYLINLLLVYRICLKTRLIPPIIIAVLSLTSYRVHSIYALRLFNDPLAMLFFYAAVNLFISNRWYLGSLLFSLAVSIKMNILLFAPGLFFLLVEHGLKHTAICLSICALTQLAIGYPFLISHPLPYLQNSFNLGRIFLFQWTVNWRFLPEHIFTHQAFHLGLLALHLIVLCVYYRSRIRNLWSMLTRKSLSKSKLVYSVNYLRKVVCTLFVSNFIGICFSRSLHYQFYVWYYHQLPFLFYLTNISNALVWSVGIGILEWCWNVYPSTIYSSAVLHAVHLALLVLILKNEGHFNRLFGSLKTRRSSFDILEMDEQEKVQETLSTRTPSKSRYRLRSSIKSPK